MDATTDELKAQKAGAYWNEVSASRATMTPRTRWNQSPQVMRHHNAQVCGYPVDGENQGLIALFRAMAGPSLPLARAVSVGCGSGAKEMKLIQEGIVTHFDLFDVSADSLRHGERIAAEWGLTEHVRFIHGNAFEKHLDGRYDLVYWDNALHHMFDARAAVAWSRDALLPGGWFLMTDFVGANRWQYPDEIIRVANLVRSSLPSHCFDNPADPATPYPNQIRRLTLEELAFDPSESADSEAIIPAIRTFFPGALIRHVGGTIYEMALNDVLTNIPEDSGLLRMLLEIDRLTSFMPHYAVAVARRPDRDPAASREAGNWSDADFRTEVVTRAWDELRAWQARYASYPELSGPLQAIDQALKS